MDEINQTGREMTLKMSEIVWALNPEHDTLDSFAGYVAKRAHELLVGATGYLVKQTPRAEVIAAIRELHCGGSPMTPNIARKVVQSFQRSKPPAVPLLSDREQQVMDLLAKGFLYKEISGSLGISQGSLHTYIRRVYEKLHVHSRSQAMAKLAKPPPADALRP